MYQKQKMLKNYLGLCFTRAGPYILHLVLILNQQIIIIEVTVFNTNSYQTVIRIHIKSIT